MKTFGKVLLAGLLLVPSIWTTLPTAVFAAEQITWEMRELSG